VAAYDLAGVPETTAEVEVIVRGGTAQEQRHRYRLAFTREGESIEVGSFQVEARR
jgi:hypothetical protein